VRENVIKYVTSEIQEDPKEEEEEENVKQKKRYTTRCTFGCRRCGKTDNTIGKTPSPGPGRTIACAMLRAALHIDFPKNFVN
jgi:hypothetical protein